MIVFLILSLSCAVTVYLYFTRNFNYWKERGIFYLKPSPFVGNLWPLVRMKCSIGEFFKKIYEDHETEPFVGIFLADKPCLVVRDFELVSRILKQDFNYFNNRIFTSSKKTDPLSAQSLFSIHGKEWKNTRAKLSPIFTAKKQKVVFDAMMGVVNKLENRINKEKTVDIKELSSCFASDIISDAVFRLDGKAIAEPNNDSMRKLGTMMFETSLKQSLRINLSFLAPEVMSFLNIPLLPESVYRFIQEEVLKAVARGSEGRRGDYIDALLDLRNKGPWEGNDGETIEPNDDVLVGQMFMFYTAGFETSASGVTYCLFEAARNTDLQKKLKDEILHIYEKYEGQLTMEAVNEMTYLNDFINECLRKHPPFPFLDRLCTTDYTIPGTDIVIEKGTKIMIPTVGLQNDKKFYEDPDEIIPERLENIKNSLEKPYFPFSTGPRQCLGMRFALLQLKLCLVACLRRHSLSLNKETPDKLKMCPKRFGNTPLQKVLIDIHRDNN